MTTLDDLLKRVAELDAASPKGPWQVWGGPDYVGGGADLCIGAGEQWLANMNHRLCVNYQQHLFGPPRPCALEGHTDVADISACGCTDECPEAVHISAEQRAMADLIAEFRTAAPLLAKVAREAVGALREVEAITADRERFVMMGAGGFAVAELKVKLALASIEALLREGTR